MALCTKCGNEVGDPDACPVCGVDRDRRDAVGRCGCPRCAEFLDTQSWEGIATLVCGSCRGTFFPDRTLEHVLNKLRQTCDPVDMATVLRDFRGRFTRELPKAVRYKKCPVCDEVMLRRNYATVSGVVIDVCADHGTWVDEHAFAELADFICRGGDQLAEKAADVRRAEAQARSPRTAGPRGGTLLDKLFRA